MTQPPPPIRDQVNVPLEEWVAAVAHKAASVALEEHYQRCPVAEIERRLRVVETRSAAIYGFMVGSGFLGGAAGALLSSILPWG